MLNGWMTLVLSSLCCAADACLRLLPLLSKVHTDWSRRPAAAESSEQPPGGVCQVPEAAGGLASACISLWAGHVPFVLGALTGVIREAASLHRWHDDAVGGAAEPLWQLHSSAVRLVHWAAATHSQHVLDNQLALLLPLPDWRQLGEAAVATLQLAMLAGRQAYFKSIVDGASEERQTLLDRCAQRQEWKCGGWKDHQGWLAHGVVQCSVLLQEVCLLSSGRASQSCPDYCLLSAVGAPQAPCPLAALIVPRRLPTTFRTSAGV